MNTITYRLYSASKHLPRVIKRPLATGANASKPTETTTKRHLQQAIPDTESVSPNIPPKVHQNVDERYEIGGRLEFSKDPLDRHAENGIPKWGPWGVPIRLTTDHGASVTNA